MANNKDDFKDNLSSLMFDERLSDEPYYEPAKFEAEHTQQIIDKLQHLSRFGNLLTLVLGERGCGKSYLLEQLVEVIHEESDTCIIKAQPLLTTSQLYQQIQTDFLAETGTAIDNDTFQVLLEEIDAPHVNRVLIIDDADTLSAEVLTNLCKLSADEQEKDSPFLKIILFANHDLNISIESAAAGILPDTGIYTLDIPGLSQADACNWVSYILQQQGYDAEQDEIESLVEEGGDNFNDLKSIAMEYVQESEEEVFAEQAPEQPAVSIMGYWFGGLTIVVLAVLGAFFYQDELAELLFPEEPVQTVVEEPISVSQPVIAEIDAKETVQDDTFVTSNEVIPDTSEQVVTEPVISELTENTSAAISDDSPPAEEVTTGLEPTVENVTGPEQVTEADEIVTAPAEVVTDTQVEQNINQDIAEVQPIEPSAGPIYTDMESRLLALPDGDYVVQIIGLTKPDAIKKIIAQHPDLDLIYYRSLLNDKPWQVIVLAGFSDYADANSQRRNLPESLAINKPWIKSVAKVKDEIRAAVNRE